jgi:hypothetical protein
MAVLLLSCQRSEEKAASMRRIRWFRSLIPMAIALNVWSLAAVIS